MAVNNTAVDDQWRGTTKGFIITMINDHSSTVAARKCIQSIKNTQSEIDPFVHVATTPDTVKNHLEAFGYTLNDWTYPKSQNETRLDLKTGLNITGYKSNDYTKVVSCLVSHMRLWRLCMELNENIIVLEHDALFTRKFKSKDFAESESFLKGILGLNDPKGATRMAGSYDRVVKETAENGVALAPWIDDKTIAQGIAGNSAYVITPSAAEMLLNKIQEIGLWPNDAIMCKQLFPWLRQAYPYYTTVQGTPSTTTL